MTHMMTEMPLNCTAAPSIVTEFPSSYASFREKLTHLLLLTVRGNTASDVSHWFHFVIASVQTITSAYVMPFFRLVVVGTFRLPRRCPLLEFRRILERII